MPVPGVPEVEPTTAGELVSEEEGGAAGLCASRASTMEESRIAGRALSGVLARTRWCGCMSVAESPEGNMALLDPATPELAAFVGAMTRLIL